MLDVASRVGRMLETKTIRRVRTEAGVRRYKQPIGSIIINDALVIGLTDIPSSLKGVARMKGDNGKNYAVHTSGRAGSYNQRFELYENDEKIGDFRDELEAYATASERVKADMGYAPGAGRLNTGGKREGWSANQREAIGSEIASWGNTATDTGNDALANELWEVSALLDQHGDARVARHQLEQLKKRGDLRLDEHLDGNPSDDTYRDVIDYSIDATVREGKLRKQYDEAGEAAYTADVLVDAAAKANQPKPIKTSEISEGQWIRSVSKEGEPLGDWMKVRQVGEQSHIPGRSRLIRANDAAGKTHTFYRQGPRDKWETVEDPKNVATQPEPISAAPEPVVPVNRGVTPEESEYEGFNKYRLANGDAVYAADEGRKTVLYDENDKKLGEASTGVQLQQLFDKLNAREQQSGDNSETGYAGLKVTDSEYEGYAKYVHDNGSVFYGTKKDGKTVIYDPDDNELFRGGLEDAMEFMSAGDATPSTEDVTQSWDVPGYPNLKESVSEYEGYQKFSGGGEDFYLQRSGRTWAAYDKDDNVIVESTGANARMSVIDVLDKRSGDVSSTTPAASDIESLSTPELRRIAREELSTGSRLTKRDELIRAITAQRAKRDAVDDRLVDAVAGVTSEPKRKLRRKGEETIPTGLTRLKDKFGGWKRYKMSDGKVIDVGQATEDDNRWYATGKDGWDDIVADGDTEADVMAKLGVMSGIEQNTTFAPANTDNGPARDYSVNTPEEQERAERLKRQWRNSQSPTQRALIGDPMTSRELEAARTARTGAGSASRRTSRDFWKGGDASRVPFKDADVERREEIEERDRDNAMMAEAAERDRIRRSATQGNTIDIKPGTAGDIGQPDVPRTPGPILGSMDPGRAAMVIGNDADYNRDNGVLNSLEHADMMNLVRGLREGKITTDQAAHALERWADGKRKDDRKNVALVFDNAREIITSEDKRTPKQIREDAIAKRAAILSTPVVSGVEALGRLSALNTEGVERNNKPLTNADKKVLNTSGLNTQASPGRLLPANNRNLQNRVSRLAHNDAEAYQALENRATNNYLNGMTQAAAWKEAVVAAESIKVPEHYVVQEGTRDGYGQHVVRRRMPDGRSSEEVITFRGGSSRPSWKQNEMAKARMSQENIKARNAATRSVPITGTPGPYVQPGNAPAASTAAAPAIETGVPPTTVGIPDGRLAEVQVNALQTYERLTTNGGWIHVSELRHELANRGYSPTEQDMALTELSRSGMLNFAPDPDRLRISSDRRINGLMLGGEMNHLVARGENSTAPRRTGMEIALDEMSYEERIENLRKFTKYGPDYNRGATEDLNRAAWAKKKGEDDTAAAWLVSAEENAGLRPRGAYHDYMTRRDGVAEALLLAQTENREMSIVKQAETIDEAGARRLAREDPARFMRVVGYRYFKQGKDLRKKENARDKEAYDELNAYADELDNAAASGRTMDGVQGVLLSMKLKHSGMMGIGRTMMTIRKVLDEENR